MVNGKTLLVVGDRVLVSPEKGEGKTRIGLYLPPAAVEKLAVQGGHVVEVGPGTPVPSPSEMGDEPWKAQSQERAAAYVPMQAKIGDYALFLRTSAVEIEFEGAKYLVVPHAAILLLVRQEAQEEGAPPDADFDEKDFKV